MTLLFAMKAAAALAVCIAPPAVAIYLTWRNSREVPSVRLPRRSDHPYREWFENLMYALIRHTDMKEEDVIERYFYGYDLLVPPGFDFAAFLVENPMPVLKDDELPAGFLRPPNIGGEGKPPYQGPDYGNLEVERIPYFFEHDADCPVEPCNCDPKIEGL